MYLNRGNTDKGLAINNVEPRHRMYLNVYSQLVLALKYKVEPRHRMYLNLSLNLSNLQE